MLLLVVAYVLTGRLGLAFGSYNRVATLLWAPSGLAVAAVWLGGRRFALGVAVGALITNLAVGSSPTLALAITLGNTAEALVADALIDRGGLRRGLHSLRDVVMFVGLVAAGSTLVAAANAAVWLHLLAHQPFAQISTTALVWWLGDAGGVLVVTPLVLAFARPRVLPPPRRSEGAVIAVLTPAIASAAFGLFYPGAPTSTALALLPFPLLVWAALRFGLRGATTATTLVTIAAVVATAAHTGPFRTGNAQVDAIGLWSLLATLSVTTLLLAIGIEERETAAEQRLALERELEAAKRLSELGLLAGGIAHDFNNLMMIVRANVALAGTERYRSEAIATIDETAVRAAELVDQLLAYAGRRPIQPRAVDLASLSDETVRMLGSMVPAGVTVQVEAEPGLPPILGDASRLRQLLMNLLMNAIQANDTDGSVVVRLSMDRSGSSPQLLLEVRDTGRGMDDGTVARVFQPFFTTKEHGRGLGMAAVLGIVRAHLGNIDIASKPGAGTTVSVSFPVPAAKPPAAEREEVPQVGQLDLAR